MSVLQVVLVYVVAPAALCGLVALLTMRSKLSAASRYRPGQGWDYSPVWWTANPDGLEESHSGTGDGHSAEAGMPRGGARGTW